MDNDQKSVKIAQLEAKVKELQRELSERVRSFLVRGSQKQLPHSPSSKSQLPATRSIHTQTDLHHNSPQKQLSKSSLTLLSPDHSPQSEAVCEVSHRDVAPFTARQFPEDLNKATLSNLLGILIEELKAKGDDQDLPKQKNIDAVGQNLEVLKWKREVKKLKEELKFQTEIAECAKEGLLLSQEENYRFRLQLQQEHRHHGSSFTICSEKVSVIIQKEGEGGKQKSSETDLGEEQVQELRREVAQLKQQVQSQALLLSQLLPAKEREMILLNQKVSTLIQETGECPLDQPVEIIGQAQNRQDKERNRVGETGKKDVVETVKEYAFKISEHIPFPDDCPYDELFRPESLSEVIPILKRAQAYLQMVDRGQNQKKRADQQERAVFSTLLARVNVRLGGESRRQMCQLMRRDQEAAPFARIFQPPVRGPL